MKKIICLLLCLVMLAALAACGAEKKDTAASSTGTAGSTSSGTSSSAATTEEKKEDVITGRDQNVVNTISEDETLTIAIELEPPFIMPNSGQGGNPVGYVTTCMIESLFEYDADTGTQYGRLAESLTWVDDLHYQVKLRDEAKFANGDPVTAEDAVFSLQLSINLSGGSNVFDVNGYKVIDDKTFEVTLLEPFVNGAEPTLAKRSSSIYSKKECEALGYPDEQQIVPDPAHPIGSGKFIFKEWVPGQYILLERNENYWDKDNMAYYKYIKFVFIVDAAARAMAIESGDADVASYITASMGATYEGSDTVTPYYLDTGMSNTVLLNPEQPDSPLANEKVREAIWCLIDAEALNKLGNAGRAAVSETLISPSTWAYNKIDVDRTVDVEKAKALLAEAGYPDGFELTMTNIAPYKAQGEVIKECLRLGGIKWDAELEEIPSHFAKCRANGAFDILIRSYNACDPVGELYNLDGRFDCARVVGRAYYVDKEWTDILDRCYYSQDKEEQGKALKEAQQYMVDHHLCVGFCTTIRLELCKKGLSAPIVNGSGTCYYFDIRPLAE